jgi:hypothetical protein
MKPDIYTLTSKKPRVQFTARWPYSVRLFTVINHRTGKQREMSYGQVMKRRRKGLIRTDERIFMTDKRYLNGVKQCQE